MPFLPRPSVAIGKILNFSRVRVQATEFCLIRLLPAPVAIVAMGMNR